MNHDERMKLNSLSTKELAAAYWDARQKVFDLKAKNREKPALSVPEEHWARQRLEFIETAPLHEQVHIYQTHLEARIGKL